MASNLSDRLQKRIGKRTKIKYDEKGNRVGGGTLITQGLVDSVRADEADLVVIRENNAEYVQRAINDAIIAALEEIGLVAEGAAKRLCPVDTGRLRNSITHAFISEREIVIGTNVEYAPYVHEGVHGRNGTPFLRDAAQNNEGRFNSIMRKHMQNG